MRLEEMTIDDFNNAPYLVQYIYACSINNYPIGISMYDEALENHPEYFPDEVEHKRKWDAIPQIVHDNYFEEFWEKKKEIEKDLPPATGIVGYMNNDEYHKKREKLQPKVNKMEKNLHKKHYSKYGIKFKS